MVILLKRKLVGKVKWLKNLLNVMKILLVMNNLVEYSQERVKMIMRIIKELMLFDLI